MRKQRGGGILDYFRTIDPVTQATKWTTLSIVLTIILIIGIILSIVLPFTLNKQDTSTPSSDSSNGNNPVGPPMSKLPGQIIISNVLGAPSAGQAIAYFSKKEASGTTCDNCDVQFDITLTYIGGSPQRDPKFVNMSAPLNSGTLLITYGQPDESSLITPPTNVVIDITARVVSNENPSTKGGPISYTKTIPYVA